MEFGSFTAERAALAEALGSVDGITAYETMPDAPQTGDAWPSWVQSVSQTQGAMSNTWHCLITCGNADLDSTVAYMDRWALPLYEALLAVGEVELSEAVMLATESAGAAFPAIRIRITT